MIIIITLIFHATGKISGAFIKFYSAKTQIITIIEVLLINKQMPIMKHNNKLLLSLDYELFFGKHAGSVENCLLKPTEALVRLLDPYNIKLSLFVDAGFLYQLEAHSKTFPELLIEKNKIQQQLLTLSEQGHDIQLHIHPHWQDSYYDGEIWIIETKRYRLHDFSPEEKLSIVQNYKETLTHYTTKPIFAFRAGGWCLQPFNEISHALKKNGIWLDSTLFNNGFSDDPTRWFNYKNMPQQAQWNFSDDPLIAQEKGYFCELPISAVETSPLFFWKLALLKLFSKKEFVSFGDGHAMVANKSYYLQRLTTTTYGPVMVDGIKAGQLQHAYIQQLSSEKHIFNVMGHPKSLSPYSLKQLELFLTKNPEIISITYQDIKQNYSFITTSEENEDIRAEG